MNEQHGPAPARPQPSPQLPFDRPALRPKESEERRAVFAIRFPGKLPRFKSARLKIA